MISRYTIGMIGFLLFFLLSRVVSTDASKKLDAETRHRIYDGFIPKNNIKAFVFVIVCISFLIAVSYLPTLVQPLSVVFVILSLFYFSIRLFTIYKKLTAIDAPAGYINSILFSWVLFIGGFLCFTIGFFTF
jgi:hypothetical protein